MTPSEQKRAERIWGKCAWNDTFDSDSDFSEDGSNVVDMPDIAKAAASITTRIDVYPSDVRSLRNAMIDGDEETERPPLPKSIVYKILDMAKYWSSVEKKCTARFDGENLNYLFFKFGPIPGIPKALGFRLKSHDQGWSDYPADHGTKTNSWTWGILDIKGPDGVTKLEIPETLFVNIHADSRWQRRAKYLDAEHSLMKIAKKGDTLEFYFRAQFPGWRLYVEYAKMTLFYEP